MNSQLCLCQNAEQQTAPPEWQQRSIPFALPSKNRKMKPKEIFVSDDMRVIVVRNHFVVFPFNNKICSLSIYIIAILISFCVSCQQSKQQPNPQSGPAPCSGGGATTATTGRPALVASRMHEQRATTTTWRAMLVGS